MNDILAQVRAPTHSVTVQARSGISSNKTKKKKKKTKDFSVCFPQTNGGKGGNSLCQFCLTSSIKSPLPLWAADTEKRNKAETICLHSTKSNGTVIIRKPGSSKGKTNHQDLVTWFPTIRNVQIKSSHLPKMFWSRGRGIVQNPVYNDIEYLNSDMLGGGLGAINSLSDSLENVQISTVLKSLALICWALQGGGQNARLNKPASNLHWRASRKRCQSKNVWRHVTSF